MDAFKAFILHPDYVAGVGCNVMVWHFVSNFAIKASIATLGIPHA
jgi:hypothetical protein